MDADNLPDAILKVDNECTPFLCLGVIYHPFKILFEKPRLVLNRKAVERFNGNIVG